ncbi:hypothetical protein HUG17_0026 [Dermatophagoides farinae]|uniref:Chitin-binding type-2 domain-containing protein n=1 Tax=Dermatophagoides farinae TaxID=6954 RepID=A0A9D4P5S2_DERFA|nr:hypothetical protein HUG17_0026 [Dermatophagoides farinae]
MKSLIQFKRQRRLFSKTGTLINRISIMNLLAILFILFSIFNSSIQSVKNNDNEPEFGVRLNNRPQTSIASHHSRHNHHQRKHHSNLNQNNYHAKNSDLIASASSSSMQLKSKSKNESEIHHMNVNLEEKKLSNNHNHSSVRIFRKKNLHVKGKKRILNNISTATTNKNGNNVTSWPINNKEMLLINNNINPVKANKSANNNRSNKNNSGGNIDDDQSTSESIYSNEYVVVGHDDYPHKQLMLQKEHNHRQQQQTQDEEEKFIRQPLLVDNLMAMSNELPPLTAALPMHYLSHESSSMDSPPLFASADPTNIASLYNTLPHSSSKVSQQAGTTTELTNSLIEKPILISHHHSFNPITSLNHQQQSISHYYDPVSSLNSGLESSGLIDTTLSPLSSYPKEAALLSQPIIHHHHHHNEHLFNGISMDYIPGIPGKPWKDYPLYSQVPKTTFHCNGAYGYFADIETSCQVWHYCQPDGRHDSFLCTNGTLFNQMTRVCDWWYNVDCKMSAHHYGVNADLYKQPLILHDLTHLQPSSHHHHHNLI